MSTFSLGYIFRELFLKFCLFPTTWSPYFLGFYLLHPYFLFLIPYFWTPSSTSPTRTDDARCAAGACAHAAWQASRLSPGVSYPWQTTHCRAPWIQLRGLWTWAIAEHSVCGSGVCAAQVGMLVSYIYTQYACTASSIYPTIPTHLLSRGFRT